MEFVFDFVKNIVAITIILSMVECLVASSEYSKYIKLFTGILIIVGILSMLLDRENKYNKKNIFLQNRGKDSLYVYKGYEENMDEKLEKVQKNIVKDYEKSITKDLGRMGMKIKNFRIKINNKIGDVEGVYIKIKADERRKMLDKDRIAKDSAYKDNIYKVISKYYVIDYDELRIDEVS